ncbi:MAG: amidohydrolase family protein, partial [Deltaproteobacteria bacterium]|nr:amidohydrolase family protein [Deltaproteobacteria bacterium]
MELIITNSTVITVDGQKNIFAPGAIVVKGNIITDLGPEQEVLQRNSDIETSLDGYGCVVLPGFVSVHNHLGYSIFRGRAEDIGHVAVQKLYVPMSTILTREERKILANLSTAELLRGGVTTVLQMEEDADVTAPFIEQIGMRAQIGIMAHDIVVDDLNQGQIVFDEAVRDTQLQQSIKFAEHIHNRAEGRLQAVIAANTAATSSPQLLRALRDAADHLKVRLSMHMGIGEAKDIQEVHGAKVFQFCQDNGFLDEDVIAVHCYMVEKEDIDLIAQSGASLAHCPLMNQFRGAIAPVEDMLNKGIQVGLGIDNYFSDHFDVIRSSIAVARIRANDPKVVQSDEAIARATIDSARVMGLDSKIGSLEIGKKADLQMINTRRFGLTPTNDPIRTLVYHGHAKDI